MGYRRGNDGSQASIFGKKAGGVDSGHASRSVTPGLFEPGGEM